VAPADAEFELINRNMENMENKLKAMDIKGNTGWRLPTFDELLRILGTLKEKGLGNFKDAIYLSSSIRRGAFRNYDYNYVLNMQNGERDYYDEDRFNFSLLVRAVRAF